MTEKELIQEMYKKHKKWLLNSNEAAQKWGSSYSSLSKLFGGKNAIPEKIILEKKLIPPWVYIGAKRMWKLTEIAKWIIEAEKKA